MVLYSNKNKIRVYSYVNVLFYLKGNDEENVFKCFLLKNLDTKEEKEEGKNQTLHSNTKRKWKM